MAATSMGCGLARSASAGRRRDAVRASASWLLRHLGAQLTAFVTSATTRRRSAWADGTATPAPAQLARLCWTAATTRLLVTRFGPVTARSWLLGDNPDLDGCAPASVLRDSDTATRWREVLDAAKTFVAG